MNYEMSSLITAKCTCSVDRAQFVGKRDNQIVHVNVF